MAIELKGTIEFKDLAGIVFRCNNCGHDSIRPINNRHLSLPVVCGNCDFQWRVNDGPEGQALLSFLHAVASYAEKKQLPFSLRFQVEGLASTGVQAIPDPGSHRLPRAS